MAAIRRFGLLRTGDCPAGERASSAAAEDGEAAMSVEVEIADALLALVVGPAGEALHEGGGGASEIPKRPMTAKMVEETPEISRARAAPPRRGQACPCSAARPVPRWSGYGVED